MGSKLRTIVCFVFLLVVCARDSRILEAASFWYSQRGYISQRGISQYRIKKNSGHRSPLCLRSLLGKIQKKPERNTCQLSNKIVSKHAVSKSHLHLVAEIVHNEVEFERIYLGALCGRNINVQTIRKAIHSKVDISLGGTLVINKLAICPIDI